MGQRARGSAISDLALVGVSNFAMQAGFAVYTAVYNNFLVGDLHITAQALGGLESLREVPGFLSVAMAALTVQFRASRLAAVSLALMGVGLAAIAGANSWWYLVGVGTIWSVGFHLYAPLSNGLALDAARRSEEGRALGWVGGIGAAGTLVGMGMVLGVVGWLGLRRAFLPAGLAVIFGAVALMFMRDRHLAPRMRLVVRRRYSIYYALTLLDGSRRQIFMTFAIFLLIKIYHVDVQHITALLIFNSIVTATTTPLIGRLLDRYGERRLLALNYGCLIFLFAGYALAHNLLVLGALYCVDNAFFSFSLGINSYLGRIAPSRDVMPSLVMGSTVNHIAAVGVPVVGGFLWAAVGYQVTFLAGAATCVLSVVAALAIREGSRSQGKSAIIPTEDGLLRPSLLAPDDGVISTAAVGRAERRH